MALECSPSSSYFLFRDILVRQRLYMMVAPGQKLEYIRYDLNVQEMKFSYLQDKKSFCWRHASLSNMTSISTECAKAE
jgi:hypothetical protein